MQNDERPSFADAKEQLRRFLFSQRWSSRCVWLPEAHVRRRKNQIWLFRPEFNSDEKSAEELYRVILSSDSSIKLIGIVQESDRSIIVIQKYQGNPGHFYMSLSQRVPDVVIVRNRLWWILLSLNRGLQQTV
jgi:hypothetical protein